MTYVFENAIEFEQKKIKLSNESID